MAFGYKELYANELNSYSQIRRAVDMGYQRGATYEIVLTGDTYISSMELDNDLYVNDERVGRITVVPYDVSEDNGTYTYKFNVRPYNYLSNYLQAEHHKYIWKNDWDKTNYDINTGRTYTNIIKYNIKFGYKYSVTGAIVTEYDSIPENDFNHYTQIPFAVDATSFTASGFTNTGEYFHLVGGSFQMDEKFLYRNVDQEIGTTIQDGNVYTLDTERGTSPMSQYIMDYPVVPEESTSSRFLTDSPRIQYIQETENHTLYFLNGLTGDYQFTETTMAYIEFYDSNNNRVDYTFNKMYYNDLPTGTTTDLTITALPCGPADLTTLYETLYLTNVAYYTVQMVYGNDGVEPQYPVSEVFYFYITENCKPENTRLTFLNARGGFDYFTFTNYRQDTKKIERSTFDSRYYSTNINSPDRDAGRMTKQYDSNIEQEFVVESDYLTETEGWWLEQLFYSPQVYEIKENYISPIDQQDKIYKDIRPVQVLSTEVVKINKNHQRLSKYRLTLKYANPYFSNKGF